MSAPRTAGRTPPARTLPPPDAARSHWHQPHRKPVLWRRRGTWWGTPWLYLLVPLTLLVTFTLLPVVHMVQYSFTDWDGLSPTSNWVGLDNYRDLFTRPQLFQVFWVSLFYLGASVVQICAALYFATILSFDIPVQRAGYVACSGPVMLHARGTRADRATCRRSGRRTRR